MEKQRHPQTTSTNTGFSQRERETSARDRPGSKACLHKTGASIAQHLKLRLASSQLPHENQAIARLSAPGLLNINSVFVLLLLKQIFYIQNEKKNCDLLTMDWSVAVKSAELVAEGGVTGTLMYEFAGVETDVTWQLLPSVSLMLQASEFTLCMQRESYFVHSHLSLLF